MPTRLVSKISFVFVVVFSTVGTGGCGMSAPEAACEDFIDAVCVRGATCGMGSESECQAAFDQVLDCGRVKGLRDADAFGRCLVEIDALSCEGIEDRLAAGDVPDPCRDQLLY